MEYSTDNGGTWTMIAENITGASYMWDVAGLAQGINYKLRATVSDGKTGGTGIAASATTFGVATTPMTFAAGFGALMTGKCSGCHAQGGPNAAQFRSDSFALANTGVDDKQQNIKTRIENNTMPRGAPLNAAEKAILTMWLWNGAL